MVIFCCPYLYILSAYCGIILALLIQLMIQINNYRAHILNLKPVSQNRIFKVDQINKYVKKLKISTPDYQLATAVVGYHLEKYLDEVILAIQNWIKQENTFPISTTCLCFLLCQYQQFLEKLLAKIKQIIDAPFVVGQVWDKLRMLALAIELNFLGKKIPIGSYFVAIQFRMNNYYESSQLLTILQQFFKMYPLEPSKQSFTVKNEDISKIKQTLLVIKNLSVDIYQREKNRFLTNEKKNREQYKKGFVLAEETKMQGQIEAQLLYFKENIEKYSQLFKFPCFLQFRKLEPQKIQKVNPNDTKGTTRAASLEDLKDFENILPGILFEDELDPDFSKGMKIQREITDFIKRLSTLQTFQEYDNQFEQFMIRFPINKRAYLLIYIIENPDYLEIFSRENIVLLARFIATFAQYWKTFVDEVSYRLKQIITTLWDQLGEQEPISEYLSKILLLFGYLVTYDCYQHNKFMSVFKIALERQTDQAIIEFVETCYMDLLENKQTEQRTHYLLLKTQTFKEYL